jgi:hypothetical protein
MIYQIIDETIPGVYKYATMAGLYLTLCKFKKDYSHYTMATQRHKPSRYFSYFVCYNLFQTVRSDIIGNMCNENDLMFLALVLY